MVHNASQDRVGMRSSTVGINYEPKSATKIDNGIKLNYNDNNDQRNLSRSNKKQDLLNKSITRSNPKSSIKKYAEFR